MVSLFQIFSYIVSSDNFLLCRQTLISQVHVFVMTHICHAHFHCFHSHRTKNFCPLCCSIIQRVFEPLSTFTRQGLIKYIIAILIDGEKADSQVRVSIHFYCKVMQNDQLLLLIYREKLTASQAVLTILAEYINKHQYN